MSWVIRGGGMICAPDGTRLDAVPAGAHVVHVGDSSDTLQAPVLPDKPDALPALEQTAPPDVISGWVRLWVAGFLSDHKGWDGVVCALHGDVSHWLLISANEVVSSQSFLTLRLMRALEAGGISDQEAVSDTMSRPERLATHLRSADVTSSHAAMTGHLLGAELAAARAYWLGQQIAVIGRADTLTLYATALEAQSCPVEVMPEQEALTKGLGALSSTWSL